MKCEVCVMSPSCQENVVSVESWGGSRKGGKREENQDSFLNWPERLLWCVADGVGGRARGAWASQLLVRNLLRIPPPSSFEGHLKSVMRSLEHSNTEMRRSVPEGSASTVVILLFHADRAACLWAGDSRCYLFRDGVLYLCTQDHSMRQRAVERKMLTEHEAARMVAGNIVTNAIGVKDSLSVETSCIPLRRGDRFLLCSDGISDLLSVGAICSSLRKGCAKEATQSIEAGLEAVEPRDDATFVSVFLSGC